eukprot:scaffold11223_cov97-Isochrysis_galbana.AAC.2
MPHHAFPFLADTLPTPGLPFQTGTRFQNRDSLPEAGLPSQTGIHSLNRDSLLTPGLPSQTGTGCLNQDSLPEPGLNWKPLPKQAPAPCGRVERRLDTRARMRGLHRGTDSFRAGTKDPSPPTHQLVSAEAGLPFSSWGGGVHLFVWEQVEHLILERGHVEGLVQVGHCHKDEEQHLSKTRVGGEVPRQPAAQALAFRNTPPSHTSISHRPRPGLPTRAPSRPLPCPS